jgi:hypothetical protein
MVSGRAPALASDGVQKVNQANKGESIKKEESAPKKEHTYRPLVMKRDKDIFVVLSNGPASVDMICEALLKTGGYRLDAGRKVVPGRGDEIRAMAREVDFEGKVSEEREKERRKRSLFMAALRERLFKLVRGGYLKARTFQYTDKGFIHKVSFFALGKGAMDWLCENMNYRRQNLRCCFPDVTKISHELEVQEAWRAIKRETGQLKYNCDMLDEYWLKKLELGKRRKKVYPDIYLSVYFPGGKRYFSVEIDNNTAPPRVIVERSIKMYHTVLILCTTNRRIDSLVRMFDTFLRRNLIALEDVENKVFLGLQYDFCRPVNGGLLGTIWKTVLGKPTRLSTSPDTIHEGS